MRLAGATRAELARALAELGVPERERNMRVSQLWHWIYHRGARDFAAMRNIARPLLAKLAERHDLAPPRGRRRAGVGRRHAQVAPAHGPGPRPRQGRRDRVRLHPGIRPGHAVRVEPGRLHPQLHVLPHRHHAARAQPDGGRDRRAGDGRRATGSATFPGGTPPADGGLVPSGEGRARGLQHRLHGHGRAALQFRGRARRDRDPDRRRRALALEAAHHRLDLRRRPGDGAARRRMRDDARRVAARDQQRAARQAGAAQPQISDRARARGLPRPIPAPPTPGGSPSNT